MYNYRRLSPEGRADIVENRVARGYPPHRPPHPAQPARAYLLTAACYEHRPHMGNPTRRQQLLDLCSEQCQARGVTLYGWVILPNHYHLLADVPALERLGELFRWVHGHTSHDWNLEDVMPGRKVWYHYADRAMRSEAHFYAALNYIHMNPVKHGCVETPYDWGHSSVHWYLEHEGRDWLREMWVNYPVRKMGAKWDDECEVQEAR